MAYVWHLIYHIMTQMHHLGSLFQFSDQFYGILHKIPQYVTFSAEKVPTLVFWICSCKSYKSCYVEEFVLFTMFLNRVKSRIVLIEIVLTEDPLYLCTYCQFSLISWKWTSLIYNMTCHLINWCTKKCGMS